MSDNQPCCQGLAPKSECQCARDEVKFLPKEVHYDTRYDQELTDNLRAAANKMADAITAAKGAGLFIRYDFVAKGGITTARIASTRSLELHSDFN